MKSTPITVTAAVIGILGAVTCFAQTPSPPASNTTPSAASSPSQRDATRSAATESSSQPSDASTPHQRQAMGKPQTMKECMDAQAARNAAMSKADMTKACNEQMKMQKDRARMSKAPETTPAPK